MSKKEDQTILSKGVGVLVQYSSIFFINYAIKKIKNKEGQEKIFKALEEGKLSQEQFDLLQEVVRIGKVNRKNIDQYTEKLSPFMEAIKSMENKAQVKSKP